MNLLLSGIPPLCHIFRISHSQTPLQIFCNITSIVILRLSKHSVIGAGLLSEREANEAFQEVLIANLTESNVGLYSMMHEKSVIMYGYGHEHSVRLAYM